MHKIEYNPEVKILKIRFHKNKSVDSDIQDNVVLDYDKNGRLVNLEIMDVNLSELIQSPNIQRHIHN